MERECVIYGLCDPDTGEVRYVGKTITSVQQRLTYHYIEARGRASHLPRSRWLLKLQRAGKQPEIRILQKNPECWSTAEKLWINQLRAEGNDLLNIADGGQGRSGPAPWARAPKSEETRRRMSEAHKGKTIPLEQRAKMSAAHTGKVVSEETKASISAGLRRYHQSKEVR